LVSDFVVLFAGHHAQKDTDIEHPYGHQCLETAAPLALGMLLLALTPGMLYGAIHKRQAPATIAVHSIALWIAGLALVSKELLFGYPHLCRSKNKSITKQQLINAARARVLQRHRVLNLMTHVDPWRPDLDHEKAQG
jgi:divalent metal cation (Fe/Co/Zn/Cd) transporter